MIDITVPTLILAFGVMFAVVACASYAIAEEFICDRKRKVSRRRFAAAKRHKARMAHIRSGAWGAL